MSNQPSEPVVVNVENFVRAESNRMFAALRRDAGAINTWVHYRGIAPVDHQNIVRQNRDTLYSAAIVDASAGFELDVPETDGRYLSVMVVDQDHYIEHIVHDPGRHRFAPDDVATQFALLGVRILVDPDDPDDVRTTNELQDGLAISAGSDDEFHLPDYDATSLDTTRNALLTLARGVAGFDRMFGSRSSVDPVRQVIGAAAGWGGLPEYEAFYENLDPGLPVGDYELTVRDVPVDGFWSVSVYNADGYFEPNELGAYNVNSVTATRDADGAVTIRFAPADAASEAGGDGGRNVLPIVDGWNYMVRLYRPRAEILEGGWRFPAVRPVG